MRNHEDRGCADSPEPKMATLTGKTSQFDCHVIDYVVIDYVGTSCRHNVISMILVPVCWTYHDECSVALVCTLVDAGMYKIEARVPCDIFDPWVLGQWSSWGQRVRQAAPPPASLEKVSVGPGELKGQNPKVRISRMEICLAQNLDSVK